MLIKTPTEINLISTAANVIAKVFVQLKKEIKVGATGKQLDKIAAEIIKKNNCLSSFLGYENFPATICVCRNEELIHGIPNDLPFKSGDLITIDVGCSFKGYHADAAFSIIISPASITAQKILKATEDCLNNVIKQIKPGMTVGNIGEIITKTAKSAGYFLPVEYGGHGIGKELHEQPWIPNTPHPSTANLKLKPGMVICVEPMLLTEHPAIKLLADNWKVSAVNGKLSCHFEHTLLITENGIKVLSQLSK